MSILKRVAITCFPFSFLRDRLLNDSFILPPSLPPHTHPHIYLDRQQYQQCSYARQPPILGTVIESLLFWWCDFDNHVACVHLAPFLFQVPQSIGAWVAPRNVLAISPVKYLLLSTPAFCHLKWPLPQIQIPLLQMNLNSGILQCNRNVPQSFQLLPVYEHTKYHHLSKHRAPQCTPWSLVGCSSPQPSEVRSMDQAGHLWAHSRFVDCLQWVQEQKCCPTFYGQWSWTSFPWHPWWRDYFLRLRRCVLQNLKEQKKKTCVFLIRMRFQKRPEISLTIAAATLALT